MVQKSTNMDVFDVNSLLQGIEEVLVSVASNIDPSALLDTDNMVTLILENILQQIIVLQPLLCGSSWH